MNMQFLLVTLCEKLDIHHGAPEQKREEGYLLPVHAIKTIQYDLFEKAYRIYIAEPYLPKAEGFDVAYALAKMDDSLITVVNK